MTNFLIDSYSVCYRGIINQTDEVKILGTKNMFSIERSIDFDRDSKKASALEMFAGSLLSDILLSIIRLAKKSEIFLADLEGKIEIKVSSPLSLLQVHGYENKITKIEKIYVTLYMYNSLTDEKQFQKFMEKSIYCSVLYNTININNLIEVSFKPIY